MLLSMKIRAIANSTNLIAVRFLSAALFCVTPLQAQKCSVSPLQVKLGQTLRITCPADFTSVKLNERSAKLYLQPDGKRFGLLAISVKDAPGTFSLLISRNGDGEPQNLPVVIRKTIFPSQNGKLSPEIESLRSTPEEMALLTSFRDAISETRSWEDPLQPPVSGCMTSPFGLKLLHNGKPTGEYHGGVEQRTTEGDAITAVSAGATNFPQQIYMLR